MSRLRQNRRLTQANVSLSIRRGQHCLESYEWYWTFWTHMGSSASWRSCMRSACEWNGAVVRFAMWTNKQERRRVAIRKHAGALFLSSIADFGLQIGVEPPEKARAARHSVWEMDTHDRTNLGGQPPWAVRLTA